ncbi:glycosyltransferase family 2 protein [Alkalihalobacterium elongatum]|uniref:glycosyltransferase family 2 protein n=1 Tax=Alkalihalobacterium elongatum TaxID=2675466 RepID=UPI001C1F57BE|nr:glycosyltransferase family 2 protein [Alkalihalobacterium elongatum]
MSIEITIIIPTYNRYPLNHLSLISLEKQEFEMSKMEVILIDDNSSDQTSSLKNYNPPYCYKYIKNKRNLGRAKTRNLGVRLAKGSILIFLDAEVIVEPNFVSEHYKQHQINNSAVCIGRYYNKVYSCLLPQFNKKQVKEVCLLTKRDSDVKKRIQQRLPNNQQVKTNFNNMIMNIKQPTQLLFEADIHAPLLKSFSLRARNFEQIVDCVEKHARIPWMGCITMNLSLRKSLIELVGGFDETFIGWGLEDYELAFRLYKLGAEFVLANNVRVSHQEHQISTERQNELAKNLLKFQQKHPFIEIFILSIKLVRIKNKYHLMNDIVTEYYALPNDQFMVFKEVIISMLKQVALLKANELRITNLLQKTKFAKTANKNLLLERDKLEFMGLRKIVKLFDYLTSL